MTASSPSLDPRCAFAKVCDPVQPVPFEELWLGLVAQAATALRSLVDPRLHPVILHDPRGPLRSLLTELARVGASAAFDRFVQYRILEGSAEFIFGAAAPGARTLYDTFVHNFPGEGLSSATTRLLSDRRELFVAATAEFCGRWLADRDEIASAFPALRGQPLPSHIQTGLSDPHAGGRTVARLSFPNGQEIFYKPRPLDMEWGYSHFVEWFNGQDHGLPALHAMSVLRRPGYGWMQAASHSPSRNPDAAARFYRRAGMILALADLFCGVDFHAENLVSCGEHPVLVDLETLFHPPGPFERQGNPLDRTELLPRLLSPASASGYVVCGLSLMPGGSNVQLRRRSWRNINSDTMMPADLTIPPSDRGPALTAGSVQELVSGFVSVHRFFLERRTSLWGAEGPIERAFAGGHSRFVLRATRIYAELLRRAGQPHAAQPHAFDRLARDGAVSSQLFQAERQALERHDIPFFTAETTGRSLFAEGQTIPEFFAVPGLEFARREAVRLDDATLKERVAAIRAALERP